MSRRDTIIIVLVRAGSKILFHLRDHNASQYPDHFAFLSGSTQSRELPINSARREIEEETGLKLRPIFCRTLRQHKRFASVHILTVTLTRTQKFRINCHEGVGFGFAPASFVHKRKIQIPGLGAALIAKPTELYKTIIKYIK